MKASQVKNKEYWKEKIKSDIHRKNLNKQIYGSHYNFASIRLNNNKKYFNEEIKIMQMEKSNRILLQKIKKISERSKPRHIIERARTEVSEDKLFLIERSGTQQKLKKNSLISIKRQRYQSIQSMLQRNCFNNKQNFPNKNNTELRRKSKQIMEGQGNKVILYRGDKKIENVLFSFQIYIQKGVYKIRSKSKISDQKIQMPEENYQLVLRNLLQNNHENIFKHLQLFQHNKLKLTFKQSRKIELNSIEKSQIQLLIIKSGKQSITDNKKQVSILQNRTEIIKQSN